MARRGHVEIVYIDDPRGDDDFKPRYVDQKRKLQYRLNTTACVHDRIAEALKDWYEFKAAESLIYGGTVEQTGKNLCPTWLLKSILWLRGMRFPKVTSSWTGSHSIMVCYN